ncbi:hypothetical protein, partial [Pseudomonas putida]|uniref:hypothetical protein n=1 Tax=Pseudomonas putida TaxID=303 RepID=UPI001CB8A317
MDYKKGKKSDFLTQRQTCIAPVIHWHPQLRLFTEFGGCQYSHFNAEADAFGVPPGTSGNQCIIPNSASSISALA